MRYTLNVTSSSNRTPCTHTHTHTHARTHTFSVNVVYEHEIWPSMWASKLIQSGRQMSVRTKSVSARPPLRPLWRSCRTSQSTLVVAVAVGCIVYTDYVYPAFVSLLTDSSCLLFLFRKGWCCFFSISCPPCVLSCLWLIGHFKLYLLVSLPD